MTCSGGTAARHLCENDRMAQTKWEVATTEEAPRRSTGQMWLILIATGGVGVLFAAAAGTHIAVMLALVPMLLTVAMLSPKSLLILLTVWMAELGLIRRVVPGGSSSSFSGDPLLIVGPAVLFFLIVVAANGGAFRERGALAKTVMAFNVVCVLEALNPKQGGFTVGLGGLLFVLVPMMAFWIGRSFLEDFEAKTIVKIVAWLGLFSALYGLFQEFRHFPSWDARWIQTSGYSALNVGNGVVRAFGSSASAQEYAAFLGVGIVAWLSLLLTSQSRWKLVQLVPIGVIADALYYEAQRTLLFMSVFAAAVVVAARFKVRPTGVLLFGALAIMALPTVASTLGGSSSNCQQGQTACQLSQRSNTIANPTGSNTSFSGHLAETRKGVEAAFTRPLGNGVGSTTLAAARFNTARAGRGTEFDPGNAGTSLGIVGLLLYLVMVYLVFRSCYRAAMLSRDVIGLFAIGIASVDLLQWMNGDLYSVTWLTWLFIGWAEHRARRQDVAEPIDDPVRIHPSTTVANPDLSSLEPAVPVRRSRWS